MWGTHWKAKAEKALKFISRKIGKGFDISGDEKNFHNQLKNGFKLLQLVNALRPGTIQNENNAETPTTIDQERELIRLVIEGIRKIDGTKTFDVNDLHDAENLPRCIEVICALEQNN